MAKTSRSQFVCQKCGASYAKWTGRCAECGAWNSLLEQVVDSARDEKSAVSRGQISGKPLSYLALSDIATSDAKRRLATGFPDLDTVLGGGVLQGSVCLLAGQPGIGKSTLLMQICAHIAAQHRVLYVSGEESAAQVKMRAVRLGATPAPGSDSASGPAAKPSARSVAKTAAAPSASAAAASPAASAVATNLNFASSTSANDIAKTIEGGDFDLVIVDSIQTLTLAEISSAPGGVSQVTNCGNLLIRAAKTSGTAVIIVGHVTKDGTLAGPKTLEHLVDVVLNFEGDRYGGFKTVRAVKNRFGSTTEAAIFEMAGTGLAEVKNPSAALLAERQNTDGSIILATLEGTRPLLVEVQALVTPTHFGYPRRDASGFDLNRLNILIAVLERRTKLTLNDKDICINIVGGLRLKDSAADLAVCLAIASAAAGRKLSEDTVVFGEVGLGGEVRSAFRPDQRISEAKKLGFRHAIAPATVKDSFVIPVTDLRTTLIDYVKK